LTSGLIIDPIFVVGNCDFELKNGSGFWGRGFIAGARYEPTTLLSKSLDNTVGENSIPLKTSSPFKWPVRGFKLKAGGMDWLS
jgi:hypothetical protein